jgi:hypothetical protein
MNVKRELPVLLFLPEESFLSLSFSSCFFRLLSVNQEIPDIFRQTLQFFFLLLLYLKNLSLSFKKPRKRSLNTHKKKRHGTRITWNQLLFFYQVEQQLGIQIT